MEALLAEDSCTGSAASDAAGAHPAAPGPAPSPGTSSRRIIPGRTMVVVRIVEGKKISKTDVPDS